MDVQDVLVLSHPFYVTLYWRVKKIETVTKCIKIRNDVLKQSLITAMIVNL